MEAKTEAIKIRQSVELPDDRSLLSMLDFVDKVAELSFKAGYQEGQTDREIESQQAYEAGKDQGRREGFDKVVDWIKKESWTEWNGVRSIDKPQNVLFDEAAWQAFLKERGK